MISGALFLLQQSCLPGVPALGECRDYWPAASHTSSFLLSPLKYEDVFTLVPTKESPWPAGETWPEDTSRRTD